MASGFVDCLKPITPRNIRHKRAVFEVQSGEIQYIAKCWSHDQAKRYDSVYDQWRKRYSFVSRISSALSEYEFYERLHQNHPDGYHSFTRSVFFGG